MARLQKIISQAGVTSRRKAEEMITEGRVKVNRAVVTELGAKADPASDIIEVDGTRITGPYKHEGPRVYILLNKPKGCISAVSDPLKRPVVTGLVKVKGVRLYPVGRLDYDAEGVLLLTNDGELANRLIHPSFAVSKKYLVKVKDVPTPEDLKKLEAGVWLEDGKTLAARARFVRQTQENSWIELTVTEGRNRLVKRMCMAIGHPVAKLKRVEFAGVKLGSLEPGAWRMLTPVEVGRLLTPGEEKTKGKAAGSGR
ncbi:MAG: rRNA pseudouridine synthase [Deltaproteobacteria bacterium]|nr:rRNA pseudouridine synthase [Deltaproteobacteria bacterium]